MNYVLIKMNTLRNIKTNFPKIYSSILCPLCKTYDDTQEHILLCIVLQNIFPFNSHILYEHMRGTSEQQTKFLKT